MAAGQQELGSGGRVWRLTAAVAVLVGLAGAGVASPVGAQAPARLTPVYKDPSYTFAERSADLVSRMTLPEKAAQLGTTNAPAIPRLGVQEYAYWSEAQHGVSAFYGGNMADPTRTTLPRATSFPTNLSASLTWDPDLIRKETSAISDEARGFLDKSLFGPHENNLGPSPTNYGNLVYWAPTVNMQRDPRWGRTDEAFGEDPFLTGTLGSAWVQGFQGADEDGLLEDRYLKAVATQKHFALNNVEAGRMQSSSDTDEGTIRDYYTAQFRRVIEKARVAGMMSSYNAINGTPAVLNTFTLNVLLRKTYGFDGYVTSDCGGVGTVYRRPNSTGVIPSTGGGGGNAQQQAIGGHDWAPPGWTTDHRETHGRWTETATGRSVTAPGGAQAFALRAGGTMNCVGAGGTASAGTWEAIRAFMGTENRLDYITDAIRAGVLSEDVLDRSLQTVFEQRMRVGEFDDTTRQTYTRLGKEQIESPEHRDLAQRVAERALTLLQNDAPEGGDRPLLPASASSLKEVVVLGDQADQVYLGGYSGKPAELVSLREGLERRLPDADITFDDAGTSPTASTAPAFAAGTEDAVRRADLVVVMVGTDDTTNAEGADRKTLDMPGNYGQLLDRVQAMGNPRIALVVQSSGPIDLTRARTQVSSILFSAANGQRQGLAAADVLLGRVTPRGKLSFTWYRDASQLPPIEDYDITPAKTDGLGRTYMHFTGKPMYPFGFGLSYTTFRFTAPSIADHRLAAQDTARVAVTVTNTGDRPGSTVAQLYATPPARRGAEQPRRKLVGFARTRELQPGEDQRVVIDVPLADTLRAWDPERRRSGVAPGTWRLAVSRAAGDEVATLPLQVEQDLPSTLRRLTLAPAQLALAPGATLDLRGANPWKRGLGPAHLEDDGSDVLTGVNEDDTFADLSEADLRFASTRPAVATVDGDGIVHAKADGVTTIKVEADGVTTSTPLVVRSLPVTAP